MTFFETITQKIKMKEQSVGEGKEKGYFAKLVEKIIDNL